MIRGILTIALLGCVVGFFASDDQITWFILGWFVLMLLGLAQKIADWLGLDDRPKGPRGPGEYFVDYESSVLKARPAGPTRSVGEVVQFNGRSWAIVAADRDTDGDYIYKVEPA